MRTLRFARPVRALSFVAGLAAALASNGGLASAADTTAMTPAQKAYEQATFALKRESAPNAPATVRREIETFSRIIALPAIDPVTSSRAYYVRAIEHTRVSEYALALTDIRASIAANPKYLPAYTVAYEIADAAKDPRAASGFAAAGEQIDPQYGTKLGHVASNLTNKFDTLGLTYARIAVQADPNSGAARLALCSALALPVYRGGSAVKPALAACEDSVRVQSGLTTDEISISYMERAFTRAVNRDYRNAKTDIDHAFTLVPATCQLYFVRGTTKIGHNNDLNGAYADLKQALAMCPTAAAPHMWLGYVYAGRRDMQNANVEWNTAVRLDPAYGVQLSKLNYAIAAAQVQRQGSRTSPVLPDYTPSEQEQDSIDQYNRLRNERIDRLNEHAFEDYADYEQHANDSI